MDSLEPTDRFDLDSFLPYRLAVASSMVSRAFASLYQERFGISVPEWRILAHLSQTPSVSVRDIFDRVDMDKSKVSRASARLERAGLVKKLLNTRDRRLVSLSLTAKGKTLVAEIIPMAREFEQSLLAKLGEQASALEAGLDLLTGKARGERDFEADGSELPNQR